MAEEDDLGQILSYNEADERLLVGKTKDSKPTYYAVFVTSRHTMDADNGLLHILGTDEYGAHADLIAAVRLPSGAFTSATSKATSARSDSDRDRTSPLTADAARVTRRTDRPPRPA